MDPGTGRAAELIRLSRDTAQRAEGPQFPDGYDHDAVVLDLMLPGLSGLEVLRRRRRSRPRFALAIGGPIAHLVVLR